MKLRSLAATTGALALTGVLLVGTAAPASAYVIGPVYFPTCSAMVSPSTVALWGVTPSPAESPIIGASHYGTIGSFTYESIDSFLALNPRLR